MTAPFVIADIGVLSLILLYTWLASGIVCQELSRRKGYGEKAGLGTGILLSVLGIIVWLVVPAKPESAWAAKKRGEAVSL